MKITVNKHVKVSRQCGSLRISIPNMIHTMTNLKEGDIIYYKSIEYEEDVDEIILNLKIVKVKKNDRTSNLRNTI